MTFVGLTGMLMQHNMEAAVREARFQPLRYVYNLPKAYTGAYRRPGQV